MTRFVFLGEIGCFSCTFIMCAMNVRSSSIAAIYILHLFTVILIVCLHNLSIMCTSVCLGSL